SARIIEAEKLAKTKKLMKLKVDTGIDTRIIVSGIAEYYEPEEIIGKMVSVLVNLSPKNLKGIESQGMILMAEDKSGKLVFVSPTEDINTGSEIK
ncbi:MAG: methionine--tRNA ligase, partial [Bacteroidales bacterium]|nr:methionine--tRNA ligase [Bacteroidales bacterium]